MAQQFDPSALLFMNQAAQVPPDQAQLQAQSQATGISQYLLPNPTQGQMPVAQMQPPPQSVPPTAQPNIFKNAGTAPPENGIAKYLPTMKANDGGFKAAAAQARVDQGANLDDIQKYINDLKAQPQGINWTPLASMIDSWNPGHSNLMGAAKDVAPMSPDEKAKLLGTLQMQLGTQRNTASQQNLNALAQQLNYEKAQQTLAETARHNAATEDVGHERNQNIGTMAGVRVGNQAIAAGKDFEKDPIIRTSKESLASLARSGSILDNPNKPVTSKDLNLAYNDYINAVAKGGAATEGKISRELPDTFEQRFNELKQKFGENDDIRKDPAGAALVNMLHENIRTVRGDLGNAISNQYANMSTTYGGIKNPMLQDIVAAKGGLYNDPNKAAQFGSPRETAPAAVGPHGMSIEQGGHTYNWNPKTGNYE